MKTSRLLLAAFAVVALVQLGVPASLIMRHELTLREGQPFKFKTAPVDPYDAFRGRYVALSFDQNHAPLAVGQKIEPGRTVYALIEIGPDGFAHFTGVTTDRPTGKPYLNVRTWYTQGTNVTLVLPFDRFYMEETKAPAAEAAYREHTRRGQQDAHVVVRVRAGLGVIENLYIGDKPIAEFLRAKAPE